LRIDQIHVLVRVRVDQPQHVIFAHSAVALPSGPVLVTGGMIGNRTSTDACEMFSGGARWRTIPSMQQTRFNHAAVALDKRHVLVVSGYPAVQKSPVHTCEIFDLASGEWSQAPSLQHGASIPRLAVRPDGSVLATGGYRHRSVDDASLFDLKSNKWTVVDNMPQPRHSHSASARVRSLCKRLSQ